MTASTPEHWDDRYLTTGSANVSWFQEEPMMSLALIDALDLPRTARIIDVGGGASRLVDRLMERGFMNLTVVDLSRAALDEADARILDNTVTWIQADIRTWHPVDDVEVWHDRAAYHFLTDPTDQEHYWQAVRDHLVPGGHLIIATFAEDGPEMCSGLPVQRHSTADLVAAMGEGFALERTEREIHRTPSGGEQAFTWVVARRT